MHEMAHYIVGFFMASIDVKEMKLSRYDDSYVEYEMLRPRIYKMMLISFAPFYINTSISIFCAYYIMRMQITGITDIIIFIFLYYVAVVTAAKALPSLQDVRNPINYMKDNLFTSRLPLIVLLAPIYLSICIPILILAKLRMKTVRLYYGIGLTYGFLVLIVGIMSGLGYLSLGDLSPIYEPFEDAFSSLVGQDESQESLLSRSNR